MLCAGEIVRLDCPQRTRLSRCKLLTFLSKKSGQDEQDLRDESPAPSSILQRFHRVLVDVLAPIDHYCIDIFVWLFLIENAVFGGEGKAG